MRKFMLASVMVIVFLATIIFCSVQKAQAQELKIAVFSIQKVFEDSKKFKDATKKLETRVESTRKSLDTKAQDIQNKFRDLETARNTLSEDAFNKRRDDLAKQYNTHMEEAQKAGAELDKARDEAIRPLMTRLNDLVANIAQERGYQFVFEVSNGVAYYPSNVDITSDLIKAVDR
jgi:outer membrane protein